MNSTQWFLRVVFIINAESGEVESSPLQLLFCLLDLRLNGLKINRRPWDFTKDPRTSILTLLLHNLCRESIDRFFDLMNDVVNAAYELVAVLILQLLHRVLEERVEEAEISLQGLDFAPPVGVGDYQPLHIIRKEF